MKHYLSTVLALACIVLVVSLVVVKHGDAAQHETDAGTIDDFSNRLDSAQTQIAIYKGSMATLSNRLDESLAAAAAFSNQLTEAESTRALGAEQITSLNRQVAELKLQNQTLQTSLDRQVAELTNRVSALTGLMTSTRADLDQAHKEYALLENRFRINVAERAVVERKFYNLADLQNQMRYLKTHPPETISAGSIYANLGVEVKSNTVHVISPD